MERTEGSIRTALHRFKKRGNKVYSRNRLWATEEEVLLRQYIREDCSHSEIAQQLQRSCGSVKAKIMYDKLGTGNVGRKPDVYKRAKLLDLLAEGCSPRQIARILTKSYNTIYKTLRRLAREGFVELAYIENRIRYIVTHKWRRDAED